MERLSFGPMRSAIPKVPGALHDRGLDPTPFLKQKEGGSLLHMHPRNRPGLCELRSTVAETSRLFRP
ncbi:MAG: hypothetical protein MUP22_14290, partial [Desulfobacterales bacterium]|nr:hypothetical protein [Desulfobacterales bacterium]